MQADTAPDNDSFAGESVFFSSRLARSLCAELGHLHSTTGKSINAPAGRCGVWQAGSQQRQRGLGAEWLGFRQRPSFLSMVISMVSRHPSRKPNTQRLLPGPPVHYQGADLAQFVVNGKKNPLSSRRTGTHSFSLPRFPRFPPRVARGRERALFTENAPDPGVAPPSLTGRLGGQQLEGLPWSGG